MVSIPEAKSVPQDYLQDQFYLLTCSESSPGLVRREFNSIGDDIEQIVVDEYVLDEFLGADLEVICVAEHVDALLYHSIDLPVVPLLDWIVQKHETRAQTHEIVFFENRGQFFGTTERLGALDLVEAVD
jgi:hypothetical protein